MDKILKNKKILLVIAFICAIGVFGGTYAYFTGRNVAKNGFTAGVYSSYVEKQFTSPENWQPGDVTPFVVNVTNEGTVDMAVRAKITEEWISSDGVTFLSGERNDERLALYEIANEEWLYTMDRYYYYTEPLLPGETTLNLIESVTFNPNFNFEEGLDFECTNTTDDAGNITQSCEGISTGYGGATFKLTVTVETIQLDHRWAYATFSDDLYEQIAWQGITDESINFSNNKVETGVYTVSSTLNDTYPIHYYRGNVTNNHLIFAGFCWEIVRTTETGGVKLLYDGIPTEKGYCTNDGYDSVLRDAPNFNYYRPDGTSTTSFSLQGVGYMYNTFYEHFSEYSFTQQSHFLSNSSLYKNDSYYNYYYADSMTYDESIHKYVLDNPSIYTWDERNSMAGKYTCFSRNNEPCYYIYYVLGVEDENSNYGIIYSLGTSYGDGFESKEVIIGKNIIDNGDGTYSFEKPLRIKTLDWYTDYNNYNNYYICNYNSEEICSKDQMKLIKKATRSGYIGEYVEKMEYLYGNSFTYENGIYKLVNPVKINDFSNEYKNILRNNHYTCLNSSGKCSKLKYIYKASDYEVRYIELNKGESVEDAIDKMLYDEDINKYNSTIKEYLENTWYKNNLLDYTSYLENSVYCNDRRIAEYNGWDPNGGDVTKDLYFGTTDRNKSNIPTLECNQLDSFTLSVENGGIKGYGNNSLKYPVGLLTYDEAILAGNASSYLNNNGENYLFTMTPHYAGNSDVYLYVYNRFSSTCEDCSSGRARPVITLKHGLEISAGVGTETEPYVIEIK